MQRRSKSTKKKFITAEGLNTAEELNLIDLLILHKLQPNAKATQSTEDERPYFLSELWIILSEGGLSL